MPIRTLGLYAGLPGVQGVRQVGEMCLLCCSLPELPTCFLPQAVGRWASAGNAFSQKRRRSSLFVKNKEEVLKRQPVPLPLKNVENRPVSSQATRIGRETGVEG